MCLIRIVFVARHMLRVTFDNARGDSFIEFYQDSLPGESDKIKSEALCLYTFFRHLKLDAMQPTSVQSSVLGGCGHPGSDQVIDVKPKDDATCSALDSHRCKSLLKQTSTRDLPDFVESKHVTRIQTGSNLWARIRCFQPQVVV